MLVRHRTLSPLTDRSIDRAFEQLTNSLFDTRQFRQLSGPAVDGRWDDSEYVVTVDLPGVPASAVSVEVSGQSLSLAAETDGFRWERSLRLSERLDPDKVTARHLDGRLTVRIGTVDEPEARKISIESDANEAIGSGSSDDAIEAGSSDAAAADQSTDTNDAG